MKKLMMVVFMMVFAMGCKEDVERFSTSEARVYKPAGLEDSVYSHIDFKDFGDGDDATLGIVPDVKGGFKLYVGVKYEYARVDVVMLNGKATKIRNWGGIWQGDLKQFRSYSGSEENLLADVRALLMKAKDYADSEYYQDLEDALKSREWQEDGFTINSFYERR